jgi:hypothetical protein
VTKPFRDPIIYPGTPIEPVVGPWFRHSRDLTGRDLICHLGGEVMGPDTVARWNEGLWECREHVEQAALADPDGEVAA